MRVAWMVVLCAVSGCVVNFDYGGTSFACVEQPVCPDGFECSGGVCIPEGTGGQDAGPDVPESTARRHQLTVSATLSESQTNAPVAVVLTADRIDYDLAGDGSDLRFVDAGGNALAHEVERWEPGGESVVWVSLPQLETGATFEMRYGDQAAASERPADLWADYQLVYHLTNAGADASGHFDASAEGGVAAGDGQLAGGAVLDGVDDHFAVGQDVALLRAVSGATVSGWVRLGAFDGSIIEVNISGNIGTSRLFFAFTAAGLVQLGVRTVDEVVASINIVTDTALEIDRWTWIAGIADFAAGVLVIYVDGVEVARGEGLLTDPTTPDTDSSIAIVGADESVTSLAAGSMDEVRLRPTAMTAGWIEAQYLSMTDALLTYGPAEPL